MTTDTELCLRDLCFFFKFFLTYIYHCTKCIYTKNVYFYNNYV